MKTLVLAGNYLQYKQYLHENGLNESDYIYAEMPKIIGHRYSGIVEYGTFWDRPDAHKLFEEAELRVNTPSPSSGDGAERV